VTGKDAGTGSLLAALAEAGFLIGLEKNRFNGTSSDVILSKGQAWNVALFPKPNMKSIWVNFSILYGHTVLLIGLLAMP